MTPHGKLEKDTFGVFVGSLWIKLEENADERFRCGPTVSGQTAREAWDGLKKRFHCDDIQPHDKMTCDLLGAEEMPEPQNLRMLAEEAYLAHGNCLRKYESPMPSFAGAMDLMQSAWVAAAARILTLLRHQIELAVIRNEGEGTRCAQCGDQRRLTLGIRALNDLTSKRLVAICLFCLQREAKGDQLPMILPTEGRWPVTQEK